MRSQLWAWSHPRVQRAQRQGWGRNPAPSNYSVIKWAFLCSDQHGHELWNSDCLILCGLKKHSPIFPKHSLSFLCEVSCLGSWWEEGVGVGVVEWLFQMLQLFQDWKQNWNDPDGWPNEAEPKSMPRGARAVFHLSLCVCMCVWVCVWGWGGDQCARLVDFWLKRAWGLLERKCSRLRWMRLSREKKSQPNAEPFPALVWPPAGLLHLSCTHMENPLSFGF